MCHWWKAGLHHFLGAPRQLLVSFFWYFFRHGFNGRISHTFEYFWFLSFIFLSLCVSLLFVFLFLYYTYFFVVFLLLQLTTQAIRCLVDQWVNPKSLTIHSPLRIRKIARKRWRFKDCRKIEKEWPWWKNQDQNREERFRVWSKRIDNLYTNSEEGSHNLYLVK